MANINFLIRLNLILVFLRYPKFLLNTSSLHKLTFLNVVMEIVFLDSL